MTKALRSLGCDKVASRQEAISVCIDID
jgi:hypothetical protein